MDQHNGQSNHPIRNYEAWEKIISNMYSLLNKEMLELKLKENENHEKNTNKKRNMGKLKVMTDETKIKEMINKGWNTHHV